MYGPKSYPPVLIMGILRILGLRQRYILFPLIRHRADVETDVSAPGVPKKRTFKKFSFRGVDLDALLDMSTDELVKLFSARARRR
ncbi:Ribosomal protein [Parasponia andersonii]|uniref:Ribosomal protein n=1 Tax=Parasponia andersonii TaxID=3476 RepID=A0A2P5A3P3_PARAD|nr:Ribosomal protein [Parasponia andersonii]